MSHDEGPPPLEDMTDYVNKISAKTVKYENIDLSENQALRKDVQNGRTQLPQLNQNSEGNDPTNNIAKHGNPKVCTTANNSGYGGMKKGFLSGGITPSKKKAAQPTITELKSNPKAKEESLKLKDVQDKMKEANQFLSSNSGEWMNESLLQTIQSNSKVSSKISNPQFMTAFSEFQSNPNEAAKKYEHNPEMKEFIQEFSGLLGNHFTSLADKQTGANS